MSPRTPEQELWISAEASALVEARQFVDTAAAAAGADEGCRQEIKMATNEAVTNALVHGSPCRDGKIKVRVVPETGALSVYVCDCGTFVPDVSMPESLPEHGRGLAVMDLLMDEVELAPSENRTVVRLRKRLGA